jgi:hypothetical protein
VASFLWREAKGDLKRALRDSDSSTWLSSQPVALARFVHRQARLLVPGLLLGGAYVGCKSTPVAAPSDAGPKTRPTIGSTRDAGLPSTELPRCGDARCEDPGSAGPLGEQACCLPSGSCGLIARTLSSSCLAPHGRGNVDLGCPTRRLVDGTVIQGCCTPTGRCGLYDRFGELGCLPGADSDAATDAGTACVYQPAATCSRVVELTCRGREDCGEGQSCCVRTSRDGFDAYGCFVSCDVESAKTSELWLEVCRRDGDPGRSPEGESCSDPAAVCSSEQGLPKTVGRCRPRAPLLEGGASVDAGAPQTNEPFCGAIDCKTGEKCCLREPAEPYCVSSGERCECVPKVSD